MIREFGINVCKGEELMNKEDKQAIEKSLKNECQFLQSVASIFDERDSEALPESAKAQNKIIYDGLMKIRSRILQEYETIEFGGLDE